MKTAGMKMIGKGAFSTVYRRSSNKVLIKSNDMVKECMSLGGFPESSMFPVLKHVGESNCGTYSFYEESYYPKVKSLKNSLKPFDWEFYKVLRAISETAFKSPKNTWYSFWTESFSSIPNKFSYRRKILLETLDALSSYGDDMCFEISPRNVAVKGGKLILLDCFFMESQLY